MSEPTNDELCKKIAELELENSRLQEEAALFFRLTYRLWHNRDNWVAQTSEARRWAKHYRWHYRELQARLVMENKEHWLPSDDPYYKAQANE